MIGNRELRCVGWNRFYCFPSNFNLHQVAHLLRTVVSFLFAQYFYDRSVPLTDDQAVGGNKWRETEEINSILLISNNFIILIPPLANFLVFRYHRCFIKFLSQSSWLVFLCLRLWAVEKAAISINKWPLGREMVTLRFTLASATLSGLPPKINVDSMEHGAGDRTEQQQNGCKRLKLRS